MTNTSEKSGWVFRLTVGVADQLVRLAGLLHSFVDNRSLSSESDTADYKAVEALFSGFHTGTPPDFWLRDVNQRLQGHRGNLPSSTADTIQALKNEQVLAYRSTQADLARTANKELLTRPERCQKYTKKPVLHNTKNDIQDNTYQQEEGFAEESSVERLSSNRQFLVGKQTISRSRSRSPHSVREQEKTLVPTVKRKVPKAPFVFKKEDEKIDGDSDQPLAAEIVNKSGDNINRIGVRAFKSKLPLRSTEKVATSFQNPEEEKTRDPLNFSNEKNPGRDTQTATHSYSVKADHELAGGTKSFQNPEEKKVRDFLNLNNEKTPRRDTQATIQSYSVESDHELAEDTVPVDQARVKDLKKETYDFLVKENSNSEREADFILPPSRWPNLPMTYRKSPQRYEVDFVRRRQIAAEQIGIRWNEWHF